MTANNQGILIIRDSEWGPYYVMGKLNGYEVYIKFGVKFWDDGAVNLVIGDWEMPFRELPRWLRFSVLRFEGMWHMGYGDGYTLYYLYFDGKSIMTLLGAVPRDVREFAEEAIEDIRRRALREVR